MALTRNQIKDLQSNLNAFTGANWVDDVPPLRVDGARGPQTRARLRHVLYWIGYGDNRLKISIDSYTGRAKRALLVRRLRHPKSRLYFTPAMLKAGEARRRKQRAEAKKARDNAPATFDGIPVEPWFVPWLKKIRARGRWKGWVVSGKRTKAHCIELCIAMCGAPRCPGRCAGDASRHAEQAPQSSRPGALDVSDYVVFANEARAVGAPFFNDLPADRVHFSRDGH